MRRRLRTDAAAIVAAVALVGLTVGCNEAPPSMDEQNAQAAHDAAVYFETRCTQRGGHVVPPTNPHPDPEGWLDPSNFRHCLQADGSEVPYEPSVHLMPNGDVWEVDPMPQSDDREYPK